MSNASACQPCGAGFYAPSTGMQACRACPAGTFSVEVGATGEDTCSRCRSLHASSLIHPEVAGDDTAAVLRTQTIVATASSVVAMLLGVVLYFVAGRRVAVIDAMFRTSHYTPNGYSVRAMKTRLGGAFTAVTIIMSFALCAALGVAYVT